MRAACGLVAGVLLSAAPGPRAEAQHADAAQAGVRAAPAASQRAASSARSRPRSVRGVSVSLAPVASAIVPGLGQALLGQQRMIAYVGAEGYFWLQFAKEQRELERQRRAYRTLAREVARFTFSPDGPDGTWDYYEAMGGRFIESGAYSTASGGQTVPETDPETFNGDLWRRAQLLYGVDATSPDAAGTPAYRLALAFYERRAVPPDRRWSWRNALLERDLYKRAIGQANESFRQATFARSVIIANHVLSAIDAFAVVRLSAPAAGVTRITATVPLPGRRP